MHCDSGSAFRCRTEGAVVKVVVRLWTLSGIIASHARALAARIIATGTS